MEQSEESVDKQILLTKEDDSIDGAKVMNADLQLKVDDQASKEPSLQQ